MIRQTAVCHTGTTSTHSRRAMLRNKKSSSLKTMTRALLRVKARRILTGTTTTQTELGLVADRASRAAVLNRYCTRYASPFGSIANSFSRKILISSSLGDVAIVYICRISHTILTERTPPTLPPPYRTTTSYGDRSNCSHCTPRRSAYGVTCPRVPFLNVPHMCEVPG